MKYIKSFYSSLLKKKRKLPKEDLFDIILRNDIESFEENFKRVDILDDLSLIEDFIKSEKLKMKCSFYGSGHSVGKDITRSLKIFPIKQEYPYIWYEIKKYDDDWYITHVLRSDYGNKKSHWVFKCDGLDGVKQLLLKSEKFIVL